MNEIQSPIISLSKWDKEKFNRWKEKADSTKLQNNCYHGDDIVFDGEIDELVCSKCQKKWTSFEFLWHWIDKNLHPKLKVYEIQNNIHFLEQEKIKLEEEIKELKSQKRKIKNESNNIFDKYYSNLCY